MKLDQFIYVGMAVFVGVLARAQTTTVTNQTYAPGTTTTVVGPTTVTTSGGVNVSSGADAIFIANTSIYLNPGFSAQPGSTFNATISSNLPAGPQATLSPSATKVEPGQTVKFTVSGSCSTGLGQIGLELCDASGNPTTNLGLANVSGNSASQIFTWGASVAGTYNFDGYARDGGSRLARSAVWPVTVIDPTTTITSQSFGTPNYNDGVEVNFSITDGGVQTGGELFSNTYEEGYDANGNFYHLIIDQWSVLLTANGSGYVAWVAKDYYHGSNQRVGKSYDQYDYDVYLAVYNLSKKQWNVTQIGSFEGGPYGSPISGDYFGWKFDSLSPSQIKWEVNGFYYNQYGGAVYWPNPNVYITNVTGQ